MGKHITKQDEERFEEMQIGCKSSCTQFDGKKWDSEVVNDIACRALADLKEARGLLHKMLFWIDGPKDAEEVHNFLAAYKRRQEPDKDTRREELKERINQHLNDAISCPDPIDCSKLFLLILHDLHDFYELVLGETL